ncbi:hypothetical protein LEN26_000796, partial [Aphanomyces euteiches]
CNNEQVSSKTRLWDYLLRNVNSAVDELYCMCELESSIPRCEDAARVLMSCHEDFVKLMELIRMQSSMSSKASLAWEVKKGSNAVKPVVVKALERMAKSPPIPLEKGDQMRPSSPTVETYPRHEKLSLPRKPKRSPSETKLLSEQRLDMVNANKHAIESARVCKHFPHHINQKIVAFTHSNGSRKNGARDLSECNIEKETRRYDVGEIGPSRQTEASSLALDSH